MDNIERELKMSLNKAEYEALLKVSNAEPQLQVNYYFRFIGMSVLTMLRIREKNGKFTLCYKRLLSEKNGINVCDEREAELNKETAQRLLVEGLTPAEVKKFVDIELPQACECVGNLSTYRTKFALGNWQIELDKNEYLGITDYELECECDSNEHLEKIKEHMLLNYGIAYKPSLSKSMRFFEEYFCDG